MAAHVTAAAAICTLGALLVLTGLTSDVEAEEPDFMRQVMPIICCK